MTKFFLSALVIAASTTFAQADTKPAEMPMMAEVVAGDLTLNAAFTRATLPGAPVAGGFVTITNTGAVDDRLMSAGSAISNVTQIHEMAMENDVMKMRQLSDGLIIPAGQTVSLVPGGYHVMFMDLNGPLVAGESIIVRLNFEIAGPVDVVMPVGAPNQKPMAHGDMPKASE